MNNIIPDKMIRDIKKLGGELPELDPYRLMKDWHTQNSIAFFGSKFLYKIFDIGKKTFTLGDVAVGEFGEKVKDKDKSLTFDSGYNAIKSYFRKKSKAPGLALMYGGTANVLEGAFGVKKSGGIRMFASFFSTLSVLKAHLEMRVSEAKQNHYIETLFGRRLYLPQLADKRTLNAGIRKVYNSPIQGTAGDLIKIFILKTGEWVEKYKLSKYQGNNICDVVNGKHFNRIVAVKKSSVSMLKLKMVLSNLDNGHTRLILLNDKSEVVKEYDRAINLPYYYFEKFDMEIIH